MALVIDILQSFVIARPLVEIDRRMRPLLEIVANIADRSHLGQIATINRMIRFESGFSILDTHTNGLVHATFSHRVNVFELFMKLIFVSN